MTQLRSRDPLETPGMPSAMQRESKQNKTKKKRQRKNTLDDVMQSGFLWLFPSNCGSFLRGFAVAARGGEEKVKRDFAFPSVSQSLFLFFFILFFLSRSEVSCISATATKKRQKNDKVSERTPRHLRESGCFPLAGRVSRLEVPHDQGHHKAGKEKDW